MIRNCHEFEERLHQLMDDRIDPETDEAICAHSSNCIDCYQSMMAFSLIHSNYLNDSDSMKIKLEHLGLHVALKPKNRPNRKHLFAVAASISAMVVLMIALTGNMLKENHTAPVANLNVSPAVIDYKLDFDTFERVKKSIESNEIVNYTSDLPGLEPFRVLSAYLYWVQKSLRHFTNANGKTAEPAGKPQDMLKFELNGSYSYQPKLLCRT